MGWDPKKRRALKTRLTLGPLLLLLIGLAYCTDRYWGGQGRVSAVLLGFLGMVGLWEYVAMRADIRLPVASAPLLLGGFLTLVMGVREDGLNSQISPAHFLAAMGFLVLAGSMVWGLSPRRHERAVDAAAASLLGFVWIVAPLYLGQKLALEALQGLLFVVLVSKGGDIGAYFFGSAFGRHKLIPHVSPGKTLEGFLGSLAVSCLLAWLLATPLDQPGPAWALLLLGLAINLAAQLGDLSESLLKRSCGVKDSSTLLPEHGGILDLVDSLLFAIPLYILVEPLLA